MKSPFTFRFEKESNEQQNITGIPDISLLFYYIEGIQLASQKNRARR
jgi:hypothetical protein